MCIELIPPNESAGKFIGGLVDTTLVMVRGKVYLGWWMLRGDDESSRIVKK